MVRDDSWCKWPLRGGGGDRTARPVTGVGPVGHWVIGRQQRRRVIPIRTRRNRYCGVFRWGYHHSLSNNYAVYDNNNAVVTSRGLVLRALVSPPAVVVVVNRPARRNRNLEIASRIYHVVFIIVFAADRVASSSSYRRGHTSFIFIFTIILSLSAVPPVRSRRTPGTRLYGLYGGRDIVLSGVYRPPSSSLSLFSRVYTSGLRGGPRRQNAREKPSSRNIRRRNDIVRAVGCQRTRSIRSFRCIKRVRVGRN